MHLLSLKNKKKHVFFFHIATTYRTYLFRNSFILYIFDLWYICIIYPFIIFLVISWHGKCVCVFCKLIFSLPLFIFLYIYMFINHEVLSLSYSIKRFKCVVSPIRIIHTTSSTRWYIVLLWDWNSRSGSSTNSPPLPLLINVSVSSLVIKIQFLIKI